MRRRVRRMRREQQMIRDFVFLALKGVRIVWVASVSKSGNTWLRYLLHNALYGQTTGGYEAESAIPHFVFLLDAVRAGTVRYTPANGILLVKTHALPYPGQDREGLFMPLSVGALYVYRNPKDICLSQINHMRITGKWRQSSDRDLAYEFLRGNLFPKEGRWQEHVTAWRTLPDFPVLQIRYEKLKSDTFTELARTIDFLGEKVDAARLHRAVERSSFEAMRQLEDLSGDAMGYGGAGGAAGRRFVNKGLSDQSISHFGSDFSSAFARTLGRPMEELGYSTEVIA